MYETPSFSGKLPFTVFSLDGMFAILVPASLLPLIITLLWAEQKAKRLGIVDASLPDPNDAPRTPGIASLADVNPLS